MAVIAQFSLYPLRTDDLDGRLEVALSSARAEGLDVKTGRMSSTIEGSEEQVFAALRAAFAAAAEHGDAILVATVSNAC